MIFVLVFLLSTLLPGSTASSLDKLKKIENPVSSRIMPRITERNYFFKNFTTLDYGNQSQNWSILQDKRGIIYVANQGGVLEYDGETWRTIQIPNTVTRSMAIDFKGTIYIGGYNEIGYLKSDSKGHLQYLSLTNKIEESYKNFSIVWKTLFTKNGVYFQTTKILFRWNPKKKILNTWKPGFKFSNSFHCNNKLYISSKEKGLLEMKDNDLQLVPGCDVFKKKRIVFITKLNPHSNTLLIGTRKNGFYFYNSFRVTPFPTEIEKFVLENKSYFGIRLKSSNFALATLYGGLFIFDKNGDVKTILDKSDGLQDDNIKNVFQDNSGNLWLALENGITKIEYSSPFSFYNDKKGLEGSVLAIANHQNKIYAGTSKGLFKLNHAGSFQRIPSIPGRCLSLVSTGSNLLAATTKGIWIVSSPKNHQINLKGKKTNGIFHTLFHSNKNPKRVWGGGEEGLLSLYSDNPHENPKWNLEHIFKNINYPILSIAEETNGTLWLGTRTGRVTCIHFLSNIQDVKITRFGTPHGLPPNEINVFWAAGHVMFATSKGIFRFDKFKQLFKPDNTLGEEFTNDKNGVFRIAEDSKRNIWIHSNVRNIQAIHQKKRKYLLNKKPFLRMPVIQTNAIYPDPNGYYIWFANVDGLYRFDTRVKKDYNQEFTAQIRKVEVINGKIRESIFQGYREHLKIDDKSIPTFEYDYRNIHFECAAPFFEGESRTQFQFKLDGYDDDWSEWSTEGKKDYTNLNGRVYTFQVRAKNVYNTISRETTYRFKVLPPWFKTRLAYLGYGIVLVFLIALIVKWRSGKLQREKQRLELIVKDRTKEIQARTIEINEKNIQLESQTVQLKEQSEKLQEMDQVKSRFFANISHEFRTPLTLIMGPLEQMINTCSQDEKEKKRKLILMLRNAQRLLRLINQLLELSKLDSGKLTLSTEKTDMISFLKGITDSFRLLAQRNEQDLIFQTAPENVAGKDDYFIYIDPRKMEDVMSNFLANALKFTPPGGQIQVVLKRTPHSDETFPEGFMEIIVSDTGPGIPQEQLIHIFDRFYQANPAYEYHKKGTGIGLALSKELVELHQGTITARSKEGEGSSFIIRLPLGNSHLNPEDIAESPSGHTYDSQTYSITDEYLILEADDDENKEESDALTQPGIASSNIILVVEDSPDMREYIKNSLLPDYTVYEAQEGSEGLQKARDIIPDLVISDIMMPEMDGYELCRELKSDVITSHIPIILLTAKASEDSIIQGLETGADDYITKPFNTKILLARIKNLIEIRSQLQKNINREMNLQPIKTSLSSIDREFLRDLHSVINRNLADPEFNVEELCKRMYMSRTTIYRKILALTGETPTDFIRSFRLKQGAELLKQKNYSVLEVAFEVGFNNSSYFAKCFKEKFHQLPSEFQAANKQ